MSAFAKFVAGEVAEAVVGGILISFAKRGIVENLLDEFVDAEAFVENRQADVDEFGGVFADDADAKKLLISASEYKLQHARGVADDVAASVVFIERAAHNVSDLLFPAGFLSLAGSGNLRNGVNAHGQERRAALFVFEAEGVAGGPDALLLGSGSQRGEADDIAGGVNVRNCRAVILVDRNVAAVVQGQPGSFECQAVDRGAPP